MKKLIFALTFLSTLSVFSQTKEDAIRDAKITSAATLEMDFTTVLKHTLPSVVQLMGGKENAISYLKAIFDGMADQGFVFEKADVIGVSNIEEEQGQQRCVVETFNQITMSGKRIKTKSYLLGIYNTEGSYWWFIEAKQLGNDAMLDQILPDFETSLEIPEDEVQTEPVDD